MISWMQKHRKYLVVTIWISTIAFVGAGFVGWGTYQYGNKSNSVAKVGEIPVTFEEFQRAYSQTYEEYNRAMGGRLDEATAKKMGLRKQVLQSLIYKALLKNFAREHGIVVSDEEVQRAILSIPAFQKEGTFDKATYIAVLQGMRMKPKAFEEGMKEDLLIRKTLSLLSPDAVPLEIEAVGSAIFMADRLRYKVFTPEDVTVQVSDEELKKYWEEHKNDYLTPKRFELAVLWIAPVDERPVENEISDYYKEHRTDFTDEKGEILPLADAKEKIVEAIRLKKAKKSAQLAYIDLKKGRKSPDEKMTLDLGDPTLSAELWQAIEGALPGSVLKPKIVNGRYAVVKVQKAVPPRPESFEEAYEAVKADYTATKLREALTRAAEKAAENLTDGTVSSFVSRDGVGELPPLDEEEAALFLQRVFDGDKRHGAVLLDNKAVSYTILEQQLLDSDKLSQYEALVKENVRKIKSNLLQNNLITRLQQKYPIEIYLKDSE